MHIFCVKNVTLKGMYGFCSKVLMLTILILSNLTGFCSRTGISDPIEPDWEVLYSDHFNIHYDYDQLELAEFLLPMMVRDLNYIEDRIGYRLSGRIDVFLYPSVSSYLHSSYNKPFEDPTNIDGGVIDIRGFDVSVYFDGNKADLLHQLRVGIGKSLITEMLYGGTTQERIKYHTLLNLPVWFEDGLAHYLASGWDNQADDILRDLFLNERLDEFNLLSRKEQIVIGRSLWNYIDRRKGDLSIPRMLYLVRLTRKLETAFYFVFNTGSREFYSDWQRENSSLYRQEFTRRIPEYAESVQWYAGTARVSQIQLSPDNEYLLYVESDAGLHELQIWNRDNASGKSIYNISTPNVDMINSKGLIAHWAKDGKIWLVDNTLSYKSLLELNKNGKVLQRFDIPFENVLDLQFSDHNELVIAASVKGQTDLFSFNLSTGKSIRITNDMHDELEISEGDNGNFYFSRRDYDSLSRAATVDHNKDVFFCIRGFTEGIQLSNVTQSPGNDESMPIRIGKQAVSYLNDRNGITNAYWRGIDGKVSALTDYRYGVIEQSLSHDEKHVVELLRFNKYYRVFVSEVDMVQPRKLGILQPTASRLRSKRMLEREREGNSPDITKPDTGWKEDPVFFQSDFEVPDNIDSMERSDTRSKDLWFERDVHQGYKLKVRKIYSQLENSYFVTDLFPSYLSPKEPMQNRFGVVLGVGLADQRMRHHITGLMRSSLSFDHLQVWLKYAYNTSNGVSTIEAWRRGRLLRSQNDLLRNKAMQISGSHLREFNDRWSMRNATSFRRDQMLPLSTGSEALQLSEEDRTLFTIQQSWIFNKRHRTESGKRGLHSNLDLNLHVDEQTRTGFELRWKSSYAGSLWRLATLKSEVDMGFAMGGVQKLYLLGGTENEWRADFNVDNTIHDRNTRYYQPIFGMRAFARNSRNGNSFFMFTNTLDVPITNLVKSRAVGGSWMRNTALRFFADLGSAWYGANPWSLDNPRNISNVTDGVLNIKIYNVKNPFIYSFGTGLSTKLYGYTVRYNLGWSYDNGIWNKAVNQISVGVDL